MIHLQNGDKYEVIDTEITYIERPMIKFTIRDFDNKSGKQIYHYAPCPFGPLPDLRGKELILALLTIIDS